MSQCDTPILRRPPQPTADPEHYAARGKRPRRLNSFAFGALLGRPLAGAAVALAGVPFLTYFVLTFCRLPPPIHPDTFARLLILAVTWLALGTVAVCVFVAVASKGAGQSLVPTYVAVGLSVIGSLCGVSLLLKHHRRLRAL